MASFKKLPSGAVQIRVSHRLLPKPLWATFDDEEQARAYASHLEALLAQGIVPAALLQHGAPPRSAWSVGRCIAEYVRDNAIPLSELKLLDTVRPGLTLVDTSRLNYEWADAWVRSMKRDSNLAPSTIRHRHGALARCFDWMMRKHPDILAQNPLRLLKRGFATYTPEDAQHLAARDKLPKVSEERDRRLAPGEEEKIVAVLARHPQEHTFFILALETAMRMRECYTLSLSQVDLERRTIHLDRSKNGDRRQVPLSTTVAGMLRAYIADNQAHIGRRDGRLFSYWSGEPSVAVLDVVTRCWRCVKIDPLCRLKFDPGRMLSFFLTTVDKCIKRQGHRCFHRCPRV